MLCVLVDDLLILACILLAFIFWTSYVRISLLSLYAKVSLSNVGVFIMRR